MKKNKFLKIGALFFAIVLIFVGVFSFTKVQANDNYTLLKENEIVESSYFAKSEVIDLQGIINGDAFIIGTDIKISGEINGNLYVIGNSVELTGKISGTILAISNNLDVVTKERANSILSVGNIVNIDTGSKNSTYIVSNEANINGLIGKDLYVTSTNTSLNNIVFRNFVLAGEKLYFGESADVNQNLKYSINTKTNLNPENIKAEITKYNPVINHFNFNKESRDIRNFLNGITIANVLISFSTLLLLGFLFARYAKNIGKKVSEKYMNEFGDNLLVGFLTLLLFPIAFILLALSIFGINIALFLLLSFVFLFIFAYIFSAIAIGLFIEKMLFDDDNLYIAAFIGAILFPMIGFLPIIGKIAELVLILVGVGCIIRYDKETVDKMNEDLEPKKKKTFFKKIKNKTKNKKTKKEEKSKTKKTKKEESKEQPKKKRGRPRKNEK
ncbi:hypothetical protein K9M42_00780 [Patescibacteria group bacterium]|nr:hypothetical protein [Patescibacteria group bacterium]